MSVIARLDDYRHGPSDAIAAMSAALKSLRSAAEPSERTERARRYRHRAEELRAAAEDVILRDTELTLLNLADGYDRMAGALENGERPGT